MPGVECAKEETIMGVGDLYRELVVERRNGMTLRGQMRARDGSVTVTSSDGRQKTTWAGGSPRAIARLMLIELEGERLGKLPGGKHAYSQTSSA
jgi:hypothetical protein